MNLKVCGSCGAYLQPEWERCRICGTDAYYASALGPTGGRRGPRLTPPTTAPSPTHRAPIGHLVAITAALLLVVAGGWWWISSTGEDSDPPPTTAPDEATMDTFAAIVVEQFDAVAPMAPACIQEVAVRPEHADVVLRSVREGEVPDGDAGVAVIAALVTECIGLGDYAALRLEAVYQVPAAAAACAGAIVEADAGHVEAFERAGELELTPALVDDISPCLSPADAERLAAGGVTD